MFLAFGWGGGNCSRLILRSDEAQVMAEGSLQPYLKFEDEEGREIPLASGSVWKIGRGEQNSVVLIDDMVSRNHAMIQMKDGEFYLIDMDSANGSFVNGRKLTGPTALQHGDRLAFGKSRLAFRNPARSSAIGASPKGHARRRFGKQAVSVLVVYLRRFASVTQSLNTHVVEHLVSTWSAEVDRIVHDSGGTAQKHLGDSVVTVWRHGAKGHEHIEILRILRAVVGITRMTSMLHESFDLAEPLQVGASVSTGLAGENVNAALPLPPAVRDPDTDLVLGASTFKYLRVWPDWVGYSQSSQENLKADAPYESRQISLEALNQFLAHHREDTGTTALPLIRPC
jgi:adenylate cyclase